MIGNPRDASDGPARSGKPAAMFQAAAAVLRRNIDEVRERARLITWLMNEDRSAVLDELAVLKRLAAENPDLAIVPGHDGAAVGALVASGVLAAGFR